MQVSINTTPDKDLSPGLGAGWGGGEEQKVAAELK